MQTLMYNLSRWTTEDLLNEVMRRTASDGPALQLLETIVIRARLAQCDRQFATLGTQVELDRGVEQAGVRGTLEMGLTERGEGASLLPIAGHEVDAATLGAHTHDHTHRRQSSTKFAAHDHHHLHPNDVEADAQLNGHSHARAHALLPWERSDSG